MAFEGIENDKDAIRLSMRQTLRWRFAALQNRNPYVALLHANYLAGNLDLMRQIWSDEEIKEATGQDMIKLWRDATELQDKYQKELEKVCKQGGL